MEMPSTKSAKKRLKQSEARRERNKTKKSALRTQIKKFKAAVAGGDTDAARREYNLAASGLDKAAVGKVIHKNTAARTKSRLAKQLANVSVKNE